MHTQSFYKNIHIWNTLVSILVTWDQRPYPHVFFSRFQYEFPKKKSGYVHIVDNHNGGNRLVGISSDWAFRYRKTVSVHYIHTYFVVDCIYTVSVSPLRKTNKISCLI